MKNFLFNHLKNFGGWTTDKKILCFAVDDYGNVLLNSSKSLEVLKSKGLSSPSRFEQLDALDTKEDYEMLFELLSHKKDNNNKNAIFTTYALPANINFENVLKHKKKYEYELLPQTYAKLSSEDKEYEGAYDLLNEGIEKDLIRPQFHGREHLNVDLFNDLLKKNDPFFMENLNQRSYAGIPKNPNKPTVKYTRAFAFWKASETKFHFEIIKDGLRCFEQVYGYKSMTFTPPALQIHPGLISKLEKTEIKSVDKPRSSRQHLGEGKYKKAKYKTQIGKNDNHVTIVRNSVFEPAFNHNINWVDYTYNQVEAAFRLKKPAIISSHRVNFCGRIDPNNRKQNLNILSLLIDKILIKFPDVEFFTVDGLLEEIIRNSKNKL